MVEWSQRIEESHILRNKAAPKSGDMAVDTSVLSARGGGERTGVGGTF